MRPAYYEQLNNDISGVDFAQAKIDERTRTPDSRHHQVIKQIVSIDDANTHVLRVVMRTMQVVYPFRRVGDAMPPILQHIVKDQQQSDLCEHRQNNEAALRLRKNNCSEQSVANATKIASMTIVSVFTSTSPDRSQSLAALCSDQTMVNPIA